MTFAKSLDVRETDALQAQFHKTSQTSAREA